MRDLSRRPICEDNARPTLQGSGIAKRIAKPATGRLLSKTAPDRRRVFRNASHMPLSREDSEPPAETPGLTGAWGCPLQSQAVPAPALCRVSRQATRPATRQAHAALDPRGGPGSGPRAGPELLALGPTKRGSSVRTQPRGDDGNDAEACARRRGGPFPGADIGPDPLAHTSPKPAPSRARFGGPPSRPAREPDPSPPAAAGAMPGARRTPLQQEG